MAIAFVQGSGTTASNTTSVARAFASNVAANSLVVIVASQWNDDSVAEFIDGDCTKTAGTATIGTITMHRAAFVNGPTATQVGLWSCLVTGGGSLTFTVTGEAASYWALTTAEFSGSFDTSRLESSNEATGTGTSPSSGNATTAGAGVFVGGLAIDAGASITTTPDAAFTQIYEYEDAGGIVGHSTIYQLVSSGTTDAASWTLGTSPTGWEAVVCAFKESGAAAATSLVIPSRAAIQSILSR